MSAPQAFMNIVNLPPRSREIDVKDGVCELLHELGFQRLVGYEKEVPTGSGPADIVLPRHRVVIETKRPGRARQPERATGPNEGPFRQLERYVQALRGLNLVQLAEGADERPWTGLVTDGKHWHVWEWPHRPDAPAERRTPEGGFQTTDGAEGVLWFQEVIRAQDPAALLRPWAPLDPVPPMEPFLDRVRARWADLRGDFHVHAQTKRALWDDMMRAGCMLPANEAARIRLFTAHSFLLIVARAIAWSLIHSSRDEPDCEEIAGNGLASWTVGDHASRTVVQELLALIHGWEWRRPGGDILRGLYMGLVDPEDRKIFGEVYTPDWLAEMVCDTVLDDAWLERSCSRVLAARGQPVDGIGVLDPSCGSGTFLLHAARRILAHLDDGPYLTPVQKADCVTALVHGIDIHPVAIEIARATLLRTLPEAPSRGGSALRIWQGDALNAPRAGNEGEIFTRLDDDQLELLTPRGHRVVMPRAFVEQPDFDSDLRRLVDAAHQEQALPSDLTVDLDADDQAGLVQLHQQMTRVIRAEGDSVWWWYLSNVTGPDRLRRSRIDRIVANPPWVAMNAIPDRDRKDAMITLAQVEGIWMGGQRASSFDIVQIFVSRCRTDYLHDPGTDKAGWLTKDINPVRKGTGWQSLRARWAARLDRVQLVDVSPLKPFRTGPGCCLILENATLAGNPASTVRLCRNAARPRQWTGQPEWPWAHVQPEVQIEEVPELTPQARSDYVNDRGRTPFRMGATIRPFVLTVIDRHEPGRQANHTEIVTWQSHRAQPRWRDLPVQRGEVPGAWVQDLVRSDDLLPFGLRPGKQAVIPLAIPPVDGGEGGGLHPNPVAACAFWRRVDRLYQEYCGQGASTPRTLIERLDYNRSLSSQLFAQERNLFMYPGSGSVMRGARVTDMAGICSDSVFWAAFDTREEAGYLTALFNADILQPAFCDARESDRDFKLHPWRKLPIPIFSADNAHHRALADLTEEAEAITQEILDGLEDVQRPFQTSLSDRIRENLRERGVMARIDEHVAAILPEQAGNEGVNRNRKGCIGTS